ncbi:MAG: hypothetical protein ABIE74_12865 [Pseudomonadota bacterium]
MRKKVRIFELLFVLVTISFFPGCGSSSSSSSNTDAAVYATFGKDLNDAIPAGLKTGGVNGSLAVIFGKTLSGTCAADYTGCPNITATGGGDSSTGEILMRLWGLDYNSECTTAFLDDGTCFDCADCNTGSVGTTKFIKPTMLANPTACATTSTTAGRYVNFGVDPCFFDSMVGQITNIAECKTVQGGDVNISSAIPWYASWGIPETVNFSSYYSSGTGGMWWTVNDGAAGNEQYFLSLDSNWLYTGIKDVANDEFLFIGTGSPAYYSGRGEGSGVNIAAYTGTLSAIPAEFEAIQVRVQDPNKYIERMRSNGSHLWYQSWSANIFPNTPADVAGIKNSPDSNRCVEIGTSVVTSKYVPLVDCVTSFGADVATLNQDDNYTLKVIDGESANSIDFSSALTPTTTTSCLSET